MQNFQDGEATQMAMDAILEIDTQIAAEDVPGSAYLEELDKRTPFRSGIDLRIVQLGYLGDLDDVADKVSFIVAQCEKTGVDGPSKATLKNWLTGSAPDSKGRENVYKLCFALEMDARQTAEFFLKAYLSRPFNYKNTREATYFFCLATKRSYQDAQRVIAQVESQPPTGPAEQMETERMGAELAGIQDETALIQYLVAHRYEESQQHTTVVSKIDELLKSCFALATEETRLLRGYSEDDRPTEVKSVDALLDVIYGYDAYALDKAGVAPLAKSRLPKSVRDNFPSKMAFSKIKDHTAKDDDIYRKALILLTFYSYYADAIVRNATADGDLTAYADEFQDELEQVLATCGYVGIYKRNPFDWLILYCAAFQNPLSQFREVIEKYYLAEVE